MDAIKTGSFANLTIQMTLLLVALAVGGSLFEHLTIDTVWPSNPHVIQLEAGGVNRKLFWIPIHSAITLGFLVALVSAWREPAIRWWVVGALAAYVAMRGWSFAYFIPEALAFEQTPALTAEQLENARTWVRLSVVRSLLLVASLGALWRAAVLAARGH